MMLRLLLLSLVLLWQCTSSSAPIHTISSPPLTNDETRSITRKEFFKSDWKPLAAVNSWEAAPGGAILHWSDGRSGLVRFLSSNVVQIWIPSSSLDQMDEAQVIRAPSIPAVETSMTDQGLLVVNASASILINLKTLSWELRWGDAVVVTSAAGPLQAGHRLYQRLTETSAAQWSGPGLSADQTQVKFWSTSPAHDDAWGPFVGPALLGEGGNRPFLCFLDSNAAAYSRHDTETGLGTLENGLNLLLATAARPDETAAALSEITGRLPLLPDWAHQTLLLRRSTAVLSFVRTAGLSIGGIISPQPAPPTFHSVVAAEGQTTLYAPAMSITPWAGSSEWTRLWGNAPGLKTAQANNLVPVWSLGRISQSQATQNPHQRIVTLSDSAGLGTVRSAWPQVEQTPQNQTGSIAAMLDWGMAGQGTPAVVLNLQDLAQGTTREGAFRALSNVLLAPVLTLDWGDQPSTLWAALSSTDQKRLKNLLAVRSSFQPFLTQWSREMSTAGAPFWKPLWAQDAHNHPSALPQDEFLVGPLLQAEVYGTAPTRQVSLPGPGVWFDFWTGEEFGGGQTYDVDVHEDRPILFVRAGGFVTVQDADTYDGKDLYRAKTIHVFPGGRGHSQYYSDDGISRTKDSGEFWETALSFDYAENTMTLTHEAIHKASSWKADDYLLYRVHDVYRPKRVSIDGKAVPLFGDSWGITDSDRSAAWYESDHTLLIKTFHPERPQTIQVNF